MRALFLLTSLALVVCACEEPIGSLTDADAPEDVHAAAAELAPSSGSWTTRTIGGIPGGRLPGYECLGGTSLATNTTGAAFFVWLENDAAASRCVLRGMTRPSSTGAWTTAETIASLGSNGARVISAPRAAITTQGDLIVTFARTPTMLGNPFEIRAAFRTASAAAWSDELVQSISGGTLELNDDFVKVAIADNGDAVAVVRLFSTEDGSTPTYTIRRDGMTRSWLTPTLVQTTARPMYQVTTKIDGTPRAVPMPEDWYVMTPNYTEFEQDGSKQFAVDAHGNAVTVWRGETYVRTAILPAGSSTWNAGQNLFLAYFLDRSPVHLAVSPTTGEVAVVSSEWEQWGLRAVSRVKVRLRNPSTGAWSWPTTLSTWPGFINWEHAIEPEASYASDGSLIIAWERVTYQDSVGVVAEAAVRTAGSSTFQGPETMQYSRVHFLAAAPGLHGFVGVDVGGVDAMGVAPITIRERN